MQIPTLFDNVTKSDNEELQHPKSVTAEKEQESSVTGCSGA